MEKTKLPRSIAFLGASSVEGFMDSEGGGFVTRFRKWRQSINPRTSIYNLGIQGDTTNELLVRINLELQMRRPKLIIFQFGSNDLSRDGGEDSPHKVYLEKFKDNVKTLIEIGLKYGEVIVVGSYPFIDSKTRPVYFGDYYYHLYDLVDYMDGVSQICQQMSVPYLDIMNKWIKTDFHKWIDDDGLHANSEGHQRIFEELQNFLSDYYEF